MLINFFDGPTVSLMQMLDAREQRSWTQTKWLERYPQGALLSMTLNIPGPVKNSPALAQKASIFRNQLLSYLGQQPIEEMEVNQATGWEYLAVFKMSPKDLKAKLIQAEEETPGGRVFDLDVLYKDKDKIKAISRQNLGFPARKCLICQENAKVCGRSRSHSLEALQESIQAHLSTIKEF